MAFKRTNFNRLSTKKGEFFASKYKFSKVMDFKVGSDVYVIPLGLETGYYETPCHQVRTHKINGQTIGYGGSQFNVYIKCHGVTEDGSKQESLCCELAQKYKEKYPSSEDTAKRIIGPCTYRMQLPVMILGNSLKDKKSAYPVSKVSILNELHSEDGIKFAYLDLSSYTFGKDIVKAYGNKLKEEGALDYETDENSEEFLDEMRQRLTETVIKIHGVEKAGFSVAMREYSFFPFSNPAIASQSPAGEREAIIGYKNNTEIMNKVTEFLTLFDVEVDSIIQSWDEKSLQEYFNSAMGRDLKADVNASEEEPEEEQIEMIEAPVGAPAGEKELSQDEKAYLESALSLSNSSPSTPNVKEPETDGMDFQYDEEEDGDFFGDDEA